MVENERPTLRVTLEVNYWVGLITSFMPAGAEGRSVVRPCGVFALPAGKIDYGMSRFVHKARSLLRKCVYYSTF